MIKCLCYNVDDVTGSWLLRGNAVVLDGQRHMRIKDVGMKLDIGDMKIYATNLINGSPELSEYLLTQQLRSIPNTKRKPNTYRPNIIITREIYSLCILYILYYANYK